MRTVQALINELRRFPPDAKCRAYEGAKNGGIVVDLNTRYGFVHCGPGDRSEPDSIGVPTPEPRADDLVLDTSSRDVTLTLPVGWRIVDVDTSSNPPAIRIAVPLVSREEDEASGGVCPLCRVAPLAQCGVCNGTGRKKGGRDV